MSRFVDRQNARFVDLGPCECPDKPHDKDWMKVRPKLTYGENLQVIDLSGEGLANSIPYSLALRIVEWSWVDEKGEPIPIEPETFQNLDTEEANRLLKLAETPEKKAPNPKRSGARSPKR